jgi:hypothetical protein
MSFDFLAPHYRWMEAVLAGDVLQRARTRWFGDALVDCRRLLIVGEGPGRTLEVICPRCPMIEITVVEESAEMITTAQKRLDGMGISRTRVTWVHADVRVWLEAGVGREDGVGREEGVGEAAANAGNDGNVTKERVGAPRVRAGEGGRTFDAVITPFVLDCFSAEDVGRVVAGIAGKMSAAGSWLLVDFCLPERGWRRVRAKLVHALMYRFFRFATKLEARRLTAPDALLGAAGFRLEGRALFNAGLVHSDWWRRG